MVSARAQSFTGTPQTIVSQHSATITDVGENGSLRVINGKPAVGYHAKGGGFYYKRAVDVSGADWSASPVLVNSITHSSPVSLSNLSGEAGNPMFAFNTNVTTAIRLKRASHADGDVWGDPTSTIASRATAEMSLAIVNGFPAVSFYDPINYDLVYVRATNAEGTAWDPPVTLDNGVSSDSRGRYSTLLVVDGRPAVAYYNTLAGELMYVRADDASGTSWPAPQIVDTDGNNGRYASMCVIDGRPAIAYHNFTSGNLRYIRANDAAGTTWGTPQTLDSGDDTGYNVSLAAVNSVPAISYITKKVGKSELRFISGLDTEGNTWAVPQVLDEMTTSTSPNDYSRTSLAEVNGTPAISYYDIANKDLKYIRSTVPVYTQSGPPILYVKVGGTGNGTSWADAMGDIQAAIDAPGVEQVWVAKGTYYSAGSGLKMKNGVAIYGGFPDDDDDAGMEERNWEANPTILHGSEERIVVNNEFSESEPLTASAILDGFTITKGNFDYAGGIVNLYASPMLTNLVVTENISEGEGGGMYNWECAPTLTNVTISDNSAVLSGGGMYNENASPVLINVTISRNAANVEGGGMYNRNSSPSIVNARINGNQGQTGGGISNDNSSPVLTNVLIYDNSSSHDVFGGGGIYNGNGSSPTLINVTVTSNTSFFWGAGIYESESSSLIYNSIIWGNGWSDYTGDLDPASSHNIIGGPDPLFVSPGSDYRLSLNSPAINAGSGDAYGDLSGATDLDGNPRLFGFAIDLGAYENQEPVPAITPGPGNILYVDQNVSTSTSDGTGSSWSNAITELADALRYARIVNNHTTENPLKIFVAKGTYKPLYHAADNSYTIDGNRRNSFVMVKNVQLYGGFNPANGVTELSDRRIPPSPGEEGSILSGAVGPNGPYHVVVASGDVGNARLDGFTITGGQANEAGNQTINENDIPTSSGGGICLWNASPVLTTLNIRGNTARTGGGAYFRNSSAVLTNVLISRNTAFDSGGGCFSEDSDVYLTNVTISGNTSEEWRSYSGVPVVRNSIIWGNGVVGDFEDAAYSLIQVQARVEDPTSYYDGERHNLLPDFDPLFNDAANGDYSLQIDSPVVDVGSNQSYWDAVNGGVSLPLPGGTDLSGGARVVREMIDMGAFENQSLPINPGPGNVLYVDQNVAGGSGSGDSWENAIPELADALRYARLQSNQNNYEENNPLKIFVARGTYLPLYDADDHHFTVSGARFNSFVMVKNVQLYGGFDPANGITELAHGRALPHLAAFHEQTVLSGDIGDPGVTSDNAYNVVIAAGDVGSALLDGFSIVGGNADLDQYSVVNGETDVMRNRGGGINNWSSSPVLTNLGISRNSAVYAGGGVSNWYGAPVLTLVNVSENIAYQGGGVHSEYSPAVITNVTVLGNRATHNGGGVYNSNANVVLTNVTVSGNTADWGEAGELLNGQSYPVIRNSIIWGNSVAGELYNTAYSLVQDQTNPDYFEEENHNLPPDTNPRFSNTATGDYTLLYCSPAINKGTEDITGLNLPPLDMVGLPRVYAGLVDMGAFESHEEPYTGPGVARSYVELEREQDANGTTDYIFGCNDWLASVTTTGELTDLTGSTIVRVWIEEDQHPADYVRRHYEIEPAGNAENATGRVTLYFTQADFDAFNNQTEPESPLPSGPLGDVSTLSIEKRGGVSPDGTGTPDSYPGAPETISNLTVIWNQDEQRWEVSFDVTGFSGFFLKTTSSPMPVRWIAFSARLNDQNHGTLEWKVDESSVLHYEVERSADARNFSKVATVTSQGDGLREYRMTDPARAAGAIYYRIRQVDLDGSYSYSRIVHITAPEGSRITLYPNPAGKGIVTLETTDLPASPVIRVFDGLGREVFLRITGRSGKFYLETAGLLPGIYHVQVQTGMERRTIQLAVD